MTTGFGLLLIWLGMLGACIGSFLNVVIFRLPRGQSLVRPGSRCPRCQAAIRPYHNLPVLSWLMLGGRCRDCRAVISWRYPLVEAVTAALFGALAWLVFGPLTGGGSELDDPRGWGLYAGLLVTATSLLVIGGILCDRQRVPRALYATLAAGLVGAGLFLGSLVAG